MAAATEPGRGGQHVRVVTDSIAWIPPDVAAEHGIRIVPLHVSFGDEQFTETVDITNAEFYRRLTESRALPKTSQPSPGEFLEAFRQASEGGASVLCVNASSRLSGTFRSAETAAGLLRQEQPETQVICLDTLQAAMAQGIVAIRAAEAAARGDSFEAIVAAARELMPKSRIYLVVDTLEYLHKGGRIGRAQALVGGLLHIRPILTVTDGEVAPKDRARTRARALQRVVELVAEYAQGRPLAHAGVFHAEAPEAAAELGEALRSQHKVERFIASELGPVIGTYLGPGAFGCTFHCD